MNIKELIKQAKEIGDEHETMLAELKKVELFITEQKVKHQEMEQLAINLLQDLETLRLYVKENNEFKTLLADFDRIKQHLRQPEQDTASQSYTQALQKLDDEE